MYPALASVDDLSDTIKGGIAATDESRAKRMLLHASVTVRSAAGQPAGYTAVDPDSAPDFPVASGVPDALVLVTLEAARRAFTNPSGYASEQQGDYSYTVAGGSASVYLTRAEKDLIAQAIDPDTVSSGATRYKLADSYRHALRPRRCLWGP